MFYRRRLPHWDPGIDEAGESACPTSVSATSFLFVTWRLAGSFPRSMLPQQNRQTDAQVLPQKAGQAFVRFDREIDKAAFGPVWLSDARIAQVMADTLLYGESNRQFYRLHAWVIMPNHVHILFLPLVPLPVINRWLKGSSARKANLILGRTGECFWQDESFDHRIRSGEELARIARYVEENPVSARLVRNPSDWRWSSAYVESELPRVE
jgi:REP element-mobilizing transposase RayT